MILHKKSLIEHQMTNSELEERLIDFSVRIIRISNQIPRSEAGMTLSRQIIRSGTSSALNYGEAQGAESRRDFNHKIQIVLKELRETYICLKIIKKTCLVKNEADIIDALAECNELISIFVRTIQTSKRRQR